MNKVRRHKLFWILFFHLFFFWGVSRPEAREEESTQYYVVQKGDTLYSVSRRFEVKLKDLIETNHIRHPNLIRPGQTLLIPQTLKIQPVLPPPTPLPLAQEELEEAGPILMPEEEIRPTEPTQVMVEEKPDYDRDSGGPKREIIGAGFGWWFTSLDAQAKVSLGNVIGTEIDLVEDLGVDDSTGIPVFNVWFSPFSWLKIQGEYMNLDVDGVRAIDERISFKGKTFRISDTVRSHLDVDRFSGWLELNPFQGGWGSVGGSLGVEYIRLEGELASDLLGKASATFEGGTPTLGGQATINLPYDFQLAARLRGMSFELAGFEVDIVDLRGGLSYVGFDYFRLSADYRYLVLDVNEENSQGDVTIQGPVLSASLQF